MKISAISLVLAVLAACGGSSSQKNSPSPETPVATPSPTPAATPAPTPETPATPGPEVAPEPTPSPEPAGGDAPAGRLASVECTPETRGVKGCTRDYKPVCGQVDTGIRCVKAPCPSTEARTFSNACVACSDPKVLSYFARSCEDITNGKAP